MVWNEQQNPQYPTPPTQMGYQPAPGIQSSPGPVSGGSQPLQTAGAAQPGYFANNPLQTMQPGVNAAPAVAPEAARPVGAGPAMSAQQKTGSPRQPGDALHDDDRQVPADDMIWVNRAKRAIAETRGDPYRKTQLLQHLRSVYLRQRFGRNVHTDEA